MNLIQTLINQIAKESAISKGLIMRTEFVLEDTKIMHEKSLYVVLDLLGAIGGLIDFFMAI